MNDTTPAGDSNNPYVYQKDDALETFARGVIDEAIAKCAASPRNFSAYSTLAAKRIADYVLEHFERRAQSK